MFISDFFIPTLTPEQTTAEISKYIRESISMMEIENNHFDNLKDIFQSFSQATEYYLTHPEDGYDQKLPNFW